MVCDSYALYILYLCIMHTAVMHYKTLVGAFRTCLRHLTVSSVRFCIYYPPISVSTKTYVYMNITGIYERCEC